MSCDINPFLCGYFDITLISFVLTKIKRIYSVLYDHIVLPRSMKSPSCGYSMTLYTESHRVIYPVATGGDNALLPFD